MMLLFIIRRWQKGKLILLASLSCWIIFTLPLGFIQPPPTSCLVIENKTFYLRASNIEQRIVKRSADLDELYYPVPEEEEEEIASNVVFERLRRSTDDNEIYDHVKRLDPLREVGMLETSYDIEGNGVRAFDNVAYDLKSNRVRRQAATTDESNVEDLRYKQLVFENNDSDAKTIDLEALQEKNRPADVLEYKRFMKVRAPSCLLPSTLTLRGKISEN